MGGITGDKKPATTEKVALFASYNKGGFLLEIKDGWVVCVVVLGVIAVAIAYACAISRMYSTNGGKG